MSTTESSDESSINLEKLKAGEKKEFEKFYNKYIQKTYSYAFRVVGKREDAEEIIQEVFTKIWVYKENMKSEGLIWTLLKHKCIDYIRKPHVKVLTKDELESAMGYKIYQEGITDEEKQKLLQKLPTGEKQVLSLLFKGFDRKEIAKILGLSLGTIDSRIHRLKVRLKGENCYG